MPLAFLNNIGFGELLVILAIVLVVFGAKRLPEIARSMGQSVAEFKKGVNEARDSVRTTVETEQAQLNAANAQKSQEKKEEQPQTAAKS